MGVSQKRCKSYILYDEILSIIDQAKTTRLNETTHFYHSSRCARDRLKALNDNSFCFSGSHYINKSFSSMKTVRGKRKTCLVARKPFSDQRGVDQRCMTVPLRQGRLYMLQVS